LTVKSCFVKKQEVLASMLKNITSGLWLVSIATILSKTLKIQFLFLSNLVPRANSSTIFKMADRPEKALSKTGTRGTKSPTIVEIFYHVTF